MQLCSNLLCAYDPTQCLCLAHLRTLRSEATLKPGLYRRAPCALKVLGLRRSCLLNPNRASTLVQSGPNLEPYPIVPNFRAWIFPHEDLPSLWHESTQSAVAIEPRTATETCRLTKKRLACENAQVIPSAGKSWFADNEMDRYRGHAL
jgi:hypothetical protein